MSAPHSGSGRRPGPLGASTLDALVVLAALAVVAALAYPWWSALSFRRQVEQAIADVEAASARARSSLELLGRWPTPGPPGEAPPELSGLVFTRAAYVLGWSTWEVVDSVEVSADDVSPPAPGDAPPASVGRLLSPVPFTVGSVAVRSERTDLLAELLDHYGPDESFVLGTTWIRILPERARAPTLEARLEPFRRAP